MRKRSASRAYFVRFGRKGPKTPCWLLLDVKVKLQEEKLFTTAVILRREQGWLSEAFLSLLVKAEDLDINLRNVTLRLSG